MTKRIITNLTYSKKTIILFNVSKNIHAHATVSKNPQMKLPTKHKKVSKSSLVKIPSENLRVYILALQILQIR